MLIGFKIKNFRSFNELQHFSMVAGKTRNSKEHITQKNNLKLLCFSSLHGANASGKSNLVLAIDLGKKIILNGIEGIFQNQYFKLKEENANLPSYFEYEIEKNDKLYSYGFEISIKNKEIISEWLIDMTNSKEKVIFERDLIKKDLTTDLKLKNKVDKNKFDVCKDDTKNNNKILFLTELTRRIKMNPSNDDSFIDFLNIYDFFETDLIIIRPSSSKGIKYNYFSKYKTNIKPLLKKLGLDITDIIEVKSNIPEIMDLLNTKDKEQLQIDINNLKKYAPKFDMTLRIQNSIYLISGNNQDDNLDVKTIKLIHNNPKVYFDTYEESDGTLRILELIDILLSENHVFLIDELDRSLHPSLTIKFVKTFLETHNNKNSQLIITTHESRLLTYKILRRDEIWFCDKNENGETTLYSLEQFKDDARFDRKIDKAYLDGRYGAVPNFVDGDNNED